MLVLLPPSEGKTPAAEGRSPVEAARLSHPCLAPAREQVLDALASVSARPDAAAVLGVAAGLAHEVARNTGLRSAPAAPAADVYTGVLFAAAGLGTLTRAATERASREVVVISALWGAVSPADEIPAYRLAMGTDLPPLGRLAGFWRPHLTRALDERARGEVVVDCRSAPYAAAWRPPGEAAWVTVRVLREKAGVRTVVSHHAKHTRGVLTRHLLARRARVRTVEDLHDAARELIGTALVDAALTPAHGRGPATLELVVD